MAKCDIVKLLSRKGFFVNRGLRPPVKIYCEF
jgi:hypothetical protein